MLEWRQKRHNNLAGNTRKCCLSTTLHLLFLHIMLLKWAILLVLSFFATHTHIHTRTIVICPNDVGMLHLHKVADSETMCGEAWLPGVLKGVHVIPLSRKTENLFDFYFCFLHAAHHMTRFCGFSKIKDVCKNVKTNRHAAARVTAARTSHLVTWPCRSNV